jgi:type I restriction enzyme S subunit
MQVNNINKDYLYYFYLNLDSSKRFKPLYKGLRNTIPKDSFFSFKTFIPPKQEQQKIVDFIENQTSKIDKAINLQQKQITKLKEYKTTLIDSVVTGKVRVD